MKDKELASGILIALFLLSSCGPLPGAANQKTTTAMPTPSQKPISTEGEKKPALIASSPTPDRQYAAIRTAVACRNSGGAISELELDSEILGAELLFRVYTPPCYSEQSEESFPVLYLLHGQSFTNDQWDRLGVDESAGALVAAGDTAPFLIVMPFDPSSQQPSIDHFGEAVVEELLPWIDANYRTIPERESRAIGGLSRGASWAFHLALLRPDLFGSVGGHSPPIFVEDAPHVRQWLNNIPKDLMPRIWLDIGQRDQQVILESAKWFAALLDELNIPHEWHLFTGNHDEAYWSSHVERYLRWYAQLW